MASSLPRLKPLWWIYFSLLLLLQLLSVTLLPRGSWLDFALFCLGSLGLVALAGYLLQRAFLFQVLWVAHFVLAVGAFLFNASSAGAAVLDWYVLLALALFVPSFWAAFAYAFRSDHLWRSA